MTLPLPRSAEKEISIPAQPDKPTALLFWGTFSENGDQVIKDFAQACQAAGDKTRCVLIDTMELFTAVQKTTEYATELARIHQALWKGPLAVDLFMRAEQSYGVSQLPSFVLINKDGEVGARFDGPQKDYSQAFAPLRVQ